MQWNIDLSKIQRHFLPTKKEQKLTYLALVKATLALLSESRKPMFPP